MKYKMIIADDEPMIIELIRKLGHWDEYDIEIIDECHDGEEALESILEKRPDFVLSDIKMPGYDGIQLIEKVREQDKDILFILISGYRYFEYARSAIQLNVVDYLLKPVDEEQLNEILERVCKSVNEKRYQKTKQERLNTYEEANLQEINEKLWKKIIIPEFAIHPQKITFPNLEQLWGTAYLKKYFQIIYVSTNINSIFQNSSLLQMKEEQLLEHSFKNVAYVKTRLNYQGNIILLNFNEENKSEIPKAIASFFYGIRDFSEIYGDFRLTIGCSLIKESVEDLQFAFAEAMEAGWGNLIFFSNKVLKYEQVQILPEFEVEDVISAEELEGICDSIKYLKENQMADIFDKIAKKAVKYNNFSTRSMIVTYLTLEKLIGNTVAEEKLFHYVKEMYMSYLNAKNFQQIFKNIFEFLISEIREDKKKLDDKLCKPMETALNYVKEHYKENISLENAAEYANVSAPYLSKLFKEKGECGFNEYLTKIRLEESQCLLRDTNLNIKEVAAEVGYMDEKYYSKLFKKITGIKPTDYRKLYG